MTPEQRKVVKLTLAKLADQEGRVPRGTFRKLGEALGVNYTSVASMGNWHGYRATQPKSEKIRELLPRYEGFQPCLVFHDIAQILGCSERLVQEVYYKEKRREGSSSR